MSWVQVVVLVDAAGTDRVPARVVVGAPGDRVARVLRPTTPARRSPRSPSSAPRSRCWCTSRATSRGSSRRGSAACSSPRTAPPTTGWAGGSSSAPSRSARSGLLFKDEIRTGARNLWLIATALIVFSAVIAAAEYYGTPDAPRRTADVEGQRHRRPGPVPGAGARRVAIRRDDQRRACSSGWTANWPRGSASCSRSPRCSHPGCSRCPTRFIRSARG